MIVWTFYVSFYLFIWAFYPICEVFAHVERVFCSSVFGNHILWDIRKATENERKKRFVDQFAKRVLKRKMETEEED